MFSYIISLAILIGINAILAVTLNFILGYAGIFSLAHAIFFGIGAYTAAIAAMKFGADLRRLQIKSFFIPVTRGRLTYDTLQTLVDDVASVANINKPLPGDTVHHASDPGAPSLPPQLAVRTLQRSGRTRVATGE